MNATTQRSIHSRQTAMALFSAIALSFAAIGPAGDGTGALQETVKYADLDVARSAGAIALYARINAAADDLCRIMDHGDLWSKTLFSRCVRQAITDAVAGVDQPALYSVYAMKNSTLRPIVLAARQSR
jgi:UrcA family protein